MGPKKARSQDFPSRLLNARALLALQVAVLRSQQREQCHPQDAETAIRKMPCRRGNARFKASDTKVIYHLGYKGALRGGIIFIAAALAAALLFAWHLTIVNRHFRLLDQPMQLGVNRMVTNPFTVPVYATYDISIYVRQTGPNVDCLLGQLGFPEGRCNSYPRVINVTWLLHAEDGRILRKGATTGTCCAYTRDHNYPVVISKLGVFSVPAGTMVYVELLQRHDLSPLRNLTPRVVVELDDSEGSELGIELLASLGIGVLVLIGLSQLLFGSVIFIASRRRSRA